MLDPFCRCSVSLHLSRQMGLPGKYMEGRSDGKVEGERENRKEISEHVPRWCCYQLVLVAGTEACKEY